MLEDNNQDGQLSSADVPQAPQPLQSSQAGADYYAGKANRVLIDMLIGSFGTLIFLFSVVPFMFNLLGGPLYYYLTAGLLILLSVVFFKIGRKNIAIGMMGIYLIPVLLFGACW